MKKLFSLSFFLAFLGVALAAPATRATRNSSSRTALPSRSAPRAQSSQPAPSRQSARPSAPRPAPQVRRGQRVVNSRPAPRSRIVVVRPYRSYRPYYGSYYRSYSYGGYGYNSYYGGYARPLIAGIRFNLDLIDKKERKMVSKGIISIDGSEFGIVDRFDSWQNGPIVVGPGDHQVTVQLPDGRIFQTDVSVSLGEIRHIYLRFEEKPQEK